MNSHLRTIVSGLSIGGFILPLRALVLAAALAALTMFSAACGGGGNDDEPTLAPDDGTPALAADGELGVLESRRPDIGEMAPDFALKDARTGQVRKLSEFRGKAVVLNWFASWCTPCEREIPSFEAFTKAEGDRAVVLALDYLEPADKAIGMLDRLNATFPALLDSDGDVAKHYRVSGLPVTYFIDKDGVVRGVKIGEVKEADFEENLKKIGIEYDAK